MQEFQRFVDYHKQELPKRLSSNTDESSRNQVLGEFFTLLEVEKAKIEVCLRRV